ncbi:MAG TPA: DoxX family protein [Candidatus Acidoferrales bacterium]|nr:DoxX family protein [Candidatus Acidoferrales bacterium]
MTTIYPIAFLIGRIIVGCFFIMSGFNHFVGINTTAGYAKAKGMPAAKLAVATSGVMLLLGGVSMLLGYHPSIGAILLVIFLLAAAFGIHNFWTVQDPQARLGEKINFLKDIALLGFVLMTLAIPRPWPISLGQ